MCSIFVSKVNRLLERTNYDNNIVIFLIYFFQITKMYRHFTVRLTGDKDRPFLINVSQSRLGISIVRLRSGVLVIYSIMTPCARLSVLFVCIFVSKSCLGYTPYREFWDGEPLTCVNKVLL